MLQGLSGNMMIALLFRLEALKKVLFNGLSKTHKN